MRDPTRTALAAVALSFGVIWAGSAAAQAVESAYVAAPLSATVTEMASWVVASGDNRGLPFVVIDKVAAEVFVFGADGQLRGSGTALLGLARGDESVPGIGDRKMSAIRPSERTTPAGRFVAGYGYARGDRKVLWIDYASAISLHPVVTSNPKERRLQRLKSASTQDNRITYGCINVSAAFYENVVRRTLMGTKGVFYVLPETKPLDEVFPAFRAQARVASTGEPADALHLEQSQEARAADNPDNPAAGASGSQ